MKRNDSKSPTYRTSYKWANKLVVRLAELDHANVKFCFSPHHAADCHFICLVLRGWEKQGKDMATLQRLARDIHSRPRRDLVYQFWNTDPGNGLMPFLKRLGTRTMSRIAYDALGTILGDPARRYIAVRQSTLSAADLLIIAKHDAKWVETIGLETLREFDEDILNYVVETILGFHKNPNKYHVLCQLRGVTDMDELDKKARSLIADCRLPIPWRGTPRVRPIPTLKDMTEVARLFRNCLGNSDMQWKAAGGCSFFYKCIDGPSVAEIRYDWVAKQWCLYQLLGPRNRRLSKKAHDKVVAAFSAAGIKQINLNRLPWAGEVCFF